MPRRTATSVLLMVQGAVMLHLSRFRWRCVEPLAHDVRVPDLRITQHSAPDDVCRPGESYALQQLEMTADHHFTLVNRIEGLTIE